MERSRTDYKHGSKRSWRRKANRGTTTDTTPTWCELRDRDASCAPRAPSSTVSLKFVQQPVHIRLNGEIAKFTTKSRRQREKSRSGVYMNPNMTIDNRIIPMRSLNNFPLESPKVIHFQTTLFLSEVRLRCKIRKLTDDFFSGSQEGRARLRSDVFLFHMSRRTEMKSWTRSGSACELRIQISSRQFCSRSWERRPAIVEADQQFCRCNGRGIRRQIGESMSIRLHDRMSRADV
jgi:hypothetical protein